MAKIRDDINELLTGARDGRSRIDSIRNPDRKSNGGQHLFEIYYWQEITALAEKELKKAWEAAATGGLIKDDDFYRKTEGETIAAESGSFSCVMKVSAPRKTLDKEAFLDAVARKARVARPWFDELWETHTTKEGKAALSKRVLEV